MDDINKEIEDICTMLDICPDEIKHIVLSNGYELFGVDVFQGIENDVTDDEDSLELEIVPDGEKKTFYHPMRVVRDNFIAPDGNYHSHSYWLPYNPYSSNIYISINEDNIISEDYPDTESIYEYLKSLEEIYMPSEMLNKPVSPETPNNSIVVDFIEYKKKNTTE